MIKGMFSVCLRRLVRGALAWVCVSAPGVAVVHAQQFSADIVMRRDDVPKPMGRISVRDGKVRIETAEHPDGFFLVDTMRPSAWFVRAAARLYMDARQSSRFTRLFIPVDPDAPCRQWQAMARLAGISGECEWRCERIGEATIGGRSTTVFRAVSSSKPIFSGWVDGARKFPLRIETDDGELMTLDQIRDEPQSASSFELPANARKFSPEALIELIKQSDVWVATPDAESSPR